MSDFIRNKDAKEQMAKRVAKKLVKQNNPVRANGTEVEAFVCEGRNPNIEQENATPFINSAIRVHTGELFDSKSIYEPDPDDHYASTPEKLTPDEPQYEAAFDLIERGFTVRVQSQLTIEVYVGPNDPSFEQDKTPKYGVEQISAVEDNEFSTIVTLELLLPSKRRQYLAVGDRE